MSNISQPRPVLDELVPIDGRLWAVAAITHLVVVLRDASLPSGTEPTHWDQIKTIRLCVYPQVIAQRALRF